MHRENIKENYAALKRQHGSKTLLLFRVDDQLEAYLEDATIIASELGLPLDNRPLQPQHPLLTVRFPLDQQESFSNRLIAAGHAIHIYLGEKANPDESPK